MDLGMDLGTVRGWSGDAGARGVKALKRIGNSPTPHLLGDSDRTGRKAGRPLTKTDASRPGPGRPRFHCGGLSRAAVAG